MKIVSICAAVAAGAILLWFPVSLFTGLIVAALVILSLLGGIKTMMGTLYAAPSIAAVAIVITVCATIITLASISASAPVRVSEADLEKAKAVALTTGKALAAIDLATANVRATNAERELKIVTAQRDNAEKLWTAAQAKLTAAATATANAKLARAQVPVQDDAPFPIPAFTRVVVAPPSTQRFRSYREDHLLIAGAYVSGTVRADCSQPATTRTIEWSRSGANWQPLREAEYTHRANEHGAMACAS